MIPSTPSADILNRIKSMRVYLSLLMIAVMMGCGSAHQPADLGHKKIVKGGVVPAAPVEADKPFELGYAAYEYGKYRQASAHFYRYILAHSSDDPDYEWARFFLGISLKRMGFSHAAVDILSDLVRHKPNPKIVSYSLELLEEVSRTLPFDREKLVFHVLSDQSYGFVDQHLDNFVNFHQGVFDWQHGFIEWGNLHFENIAPGTYYFYQYQYQLALYRVYKNNPEGAIELLTAILDQPIGDTGFKDDVRQTLARLYYEVGRFEAADQVYREIETPVLNQAHHLLERAWIHYRMDNPETAMGYLYAYRAPSFQNYFTPEYYILKSFIYQSVCHYEKALAVIGEFDDYYAGALAAIHDRSDIKDNPVLLRVIIHQKQIKAAWDFLVLLEKEHQQVAALSDTALRQFLDQIYTLQLSKTRTEFRKKMQGAYEKMADDLLQYEEESHLVSYEIGLDMVQRVKQYHYREKGDASDAKDANRLIAYPFQGEFWSHELDDYHVTLVDKCQSAEEWDVFFK
jgi:tetratricopeptide (TPR) repeat protein